jgi:sugar phosphate isomerase/epimerase
MTVVGAVTADPITAQTVLYGGCLATIPFAGIVSAAGVAGFDAVSLWPHMYRHALGRDGLDPQAMRRLLDEAGIVVTELEAYGDWLPDASATFAFRSGWTAAEFFDAACALGADTIAAVHSGAGPVDRAEATDRFAALCEAAAGNGLRISLEPVAFSGIDTLAAGWGIVSDAACSNGGITLDTAHLVRGGWDEELLRSVSADKIFSVQLVDGPLEAPADLVDEAKFHRQLPGDGEFPIARILTILTEMGVCTRVGPEVFLPPRDGESAPDSARRLARSIHHDFAASA